jgi:hypothetical protein
VQGLKALILRFTTLVVRTALQELARPRSRPLLAKLVDQLPATSTEVRIDVAHAIGELARPAVATHLGTLIEGLASSAAPRNDDPIQIDVEHFVRELGSGRVNPRLVHLFTWNHRWMALLAEKNRRTAVEVYDFIDAEMPNALFSINQFEVIESKREEMAEVDGWILDLGVYKGASTRALARIFRVASIHGFDSFEGLPEDWSHVTKGAFGDIEQNLPEVPDNVTLHKGWFDDTLPPWAEEHGDRPISILRVDCDIYSSTATIFDTVGHMLRPGSWIVFDELIGYRGWRDHEYKAFNEFLKDHPFTVEYIAYGLTYVIVRLGDPDLDGRDT